jgi:hypothetical protein
MKLGTSDCWIGTPTGAGECKAFLVTSAAAYECAAAHSMDPWATTKKVLY